MSRTLSQFFLAQLPQPVHVRRTTGHGAFGDLYGTSYGCPRRKGICCRLRFHLDNSNSRILRSTIVGTILEIA